MELSNKTFKKYAVNMTLTLAQGQGHCINSSHCCADDDDFFFSTSTDCRLLMRMCFLDIPTEAAGNTENLYMCEATSRGRSRRSET